MQLNHSQLTYYDTYNWTSIILQALRKSVTTKGFNEIIPALLSKNYEPGARHSIAILGNKEVPQICKVSAISGEQQLKVIGKESYFLPVSHVVEKQMSLQYMNKVYCLAPCLRLIMEGEEYSGKHLYNFFQFEIEWRTESMQQVFDLGEQIIKDAAADIYNIMETTDDSYFNNISRKNLQALMKSNYPRITFKKALQMLGKPMNFKGDLSQEDDYRLSMMFDRPFWIYDYPDGVRDSIYHQNEHGYFDTYDLMLPFGYGELTTGGIRAKDEQEITEQSAKLGQNYNPDYLQWKKNSKVQSAGFGIGLERILRFMSEADSILDFIQFHDKGPNNYINHNFIIEKAQKV
jgi:asparaginyl-tRNA synthetase